MSNCTALPPGDRCARRRGRAQAWARARAARLRPGSPTAAPPPGAAAARPPAGTARRRLPPRCAPSPVRHRTQPVCFQTSPCAPVVLSGHHHAQPASFPSFTTRNQYASGLDTKSSAGSRPLSRAGAPQAQNSAAGPGQRRGGEHAGSAPARTRATWTRAGGADRRRCARRATSPPGPRAARSGR